MTVTRVKTDHHVIDFRSKKLYKEVLKDCRDLGISLDYYFFEFELEADDLPEDEIDDD